ncbi:cytochrome P450 [Synechococcus sp. CS-1328]|nr:cytochrome P450 [Synechococcus sp. CS-1328]
MTLAERSAFHQDPCLPGHHDPYPIYAALAAESPVHWCEGPQMWIILGHPEAVAHMHDPRCSRQRHLDKLIDRLGSGHLFHDQKLDIPYMDGEPHAQVRHHVMETFRGIDIPGLEAFTRRFIAERLDRISPGRAFDLVPLLADPLPVAVTSELIGVPPDLQQEVLMHVPSFVRARGLTQTEQTTAAGDGAIDIYRRFFLPLIHERRASPQDDLLSRLMVDPHHGRPISDEQLLLFISSNFYSASVFTLRLLVGTIAWAMASHPAAFQRLRNDSSLLDTALEEVVCWDPPAQALNASVATEPIELAGHTIPAGDSLTALVGAANRDPRVFPDPQVFRIERDPNPHVSFAPGLHQCLGRQLARLQGRAVLEAFRQRFSAIHWQEAASHRFVGDRFRGFDRLILEVE